MDEFNRFNMESLLQTSTPREELHGSSVGHDSRGAVADESPQLNEKGLQHVCEALRFVVIDTHLFGVKDKND